MAAAHARRRWLAFVVLCLGVLMIVLDTTIVNVALPSIQRELGIGLSELQWIVTGYALSFAALMLMGGKLADLLGRRLVFVVGLALVLVYGRDGWLGFVNAGAEASMVGAMADWFAVTALFRHPLRLPIPHTALIPKRKDELGRGLEEFVDKIEQKLGRPIEGAKIAVWGLAFKPRTDDMREAPAITIIERLLAAGAAVRAYDPEAAPTARRIFNGRIALCEKSYDALKGADALAIVTEWNEFREPDFERMRKLLREPVIFDGRNLYKPDKLARLGFQYYYIGQKLD